MVDYLDKLDNAKKSLQIADHMLNITHNVVNDPKLLLLVLKKLFRALNNTISAILYYELYYKKIPPFQESFSEMFNIFKMRAFRRYNLNTSYIELIQDVHSTLKEQKEGPVSFARKGSYVICSSDYKIKVLSKDSLKLYIEKTKVFIRDAESMIT